MADGKVVIDTELNDDGLKKGLNGLSSKVGSGISGAAKAVTAGLAVAGAGVVKLAQQSINAYGEYQQMVGGVQKLYGNMGMSLEEYAESVGKTTDQVADEWQKLENAQNIVLQNAADAYKTAGMSMNQYMETATSFSAALINSLDGDMEAAAEKTQLAMVAIADNWNTFGGDLENIRHAFQGFAKQNYTMLDNLKLGYGGTKTEMERLIDDANEYAATIGQANDLSIDSFSDVVTAIDLIQQKQGIAGTTAREAQTTLQGSLNMTKSAWENLLTIMGDPKGDMTKGIDNLMESLEALMSNAIPIVKQVLSGISRIVGDLVPMIADKIPGLVQELAPVFISAAGEIVIAVIKSLPSIMGAVWTSLTQDFSTGIAGLIGVIAIKGQGITQMFGKIFEGAANGILKKAGFEKGIESLMEVIGGKISAGASKIINNFDWFGSELILKMQSGISKAAPAISNAFSSVVGSIGSVFSKIPGLIMGAFSGITGFFGTLTSTLAPIMTAFWSVLTGPVGIVIAAVAAVIAIFVLLYNFFEPFRNFVDTFVKGIQQIFSGDFAGAAETFRGLWQGVADFWAGIWDSIMQVLQGAWDWICGIFQGIIDFVANNWQGLLLFLVNPIAGAFKLLYDNCEEFRNFVDQFVQAVIQFFQELPQNVANVVQAILQWFAELPGNIWNLLVQVITTVGQWAINLWNAGTNAASQLFNAVVNGIMALPGRMLEIGANIVQGIWNGISNMVGWLMDKIKGFADNIVKGVQAFLGIGSPSKVFRDKVGKWIGPGITVGWEMNNPLPQIKKDIEVGLQSIQASTNIDLQTSQNSQVESAQDAAEQPAIVMNFNDVQTSPDSIYQKFRQQMTYGLEKKY